jgi:nitroimidazol reductase NimA-like FMN-containing flavoprotein (pyridoxamine 5'-phosphate oxidase superfamily)
MCNEKW